jgi:hypothetical protein
MILSVPKGKIFICIYLGHLQPTQDDNDDVNDKSDDEENQDDGDDAIMVGGRWLVVEYCIVVYLSCTCHSGLPKLYMS